MLCCTLAYGQGDTSRRKKHKEKQEKVATQNVIDTQKQTVDFMGVIIDEKTGEPLVGVTVMLSKEGFQKGVMSDLNGKFIFTELAAGNYKLKLTYVSYEGKEMDNISLEQGKQYQMAFTLKEVGVNVEEVVIQSDLRKESEAAALVMQKMNLRIMDIFAGDMILKTTSDLFVTTALNRMPGVVFIEDKYLGIRGMPERYNTIMLNGALLPIVNIERQSFDFSNLPSNMISQIQLVKSCISDIPATFGGGLVSFETQGIPDKNIIQFNYQTIYNSLTTFKPFTYGLHDKSKGFVGLFGSPKSYLPNDFPSSSYIQGLDVQSEELADLGRKVNYNYQTQTATAMPSQSFSFTLARRWEKEQNIYGLSIISNLTNNLTKQQIQQNVLSEFDPDLGYNPVGDSSNYPLFQRQQNYNQIINWGYQNQKLQIIFKNLFTFSQWDKYINQFGSFYFDNAWEPYQFNVKRFERQFLYSGQVNAQYQIQPNQKLSFSIFSNYVYFKEPGYYPINFSLNSDNQWYISDSWVPEDRGFYTVYTSKQKDFSYGMNVSYENLIWKHNKQSLQFKTGIFLYNQDRNFSSRKAGLVPTLDSTVNINVQELLAQNGQFTYDPALIRPGGFFLFDDTQIHDSYLGNSLNIATYLQITHKIADKIQIFGGLRIESAITEIYSNGNENAQEKIHYQKLLDFLPSFIFNYDWNTEHKIKFSYCQSVIRPDLRELSLFSFFNTFNSVTWEGNPNAIRSKINSYDLRYEFFNGGLNMFSVTLFYKYIYRPLEQVLSQGETVYLNTYTLKNAEYANNYGIELEIRQKLANENYLKNFSVYGNLMFQNSNVKDDRTGKTNRPLQGQSPFVINTGILFQEPSTNFTFDLFYNRFGRQIVIIGVPGSYNNLYILPRHRVDFQIGKTFKEKLMIKLAFQDLFAQPFYKVQFQTNEKNGQLQDATLVSKTQVGRLVTLSLQYKF